MNTYYYILDAHENYIFDNFPSNLSNLVKNYSDKVKQIEIIVDEKKVNARIGKRSNQYGTIYTLTTEEKFIVRNKFFRELLDMSLFSLGPLINLQKNIIKTQKDEIEEFTHNVTSLNSHSIQDLFALIPQNTLSENINKQKDTIKSIILSKPDETVLALLKLIKYNLAMKVEFSVFERIKKPIADVQKMQHSIREIVLSILQIFIEDFDKKNIEVTLDAGDVSERRIEVDYDSLFVSLFYIFENSIKYCCPRTTFKIIFKEDEGFFSVLFIMISIKIQENETTRLTENGYRSDSAKAINADGKGIGMYKIVKTLKLNNAELEITPRINNFVKKIGNIEYEGNQFKIKFSEKKNWFNR